MGYPAHYRNTSPQTGFRPRGRSLGPGRVIPFPKPYRSPRLPFGPPTPLPGRSGFGLRPRFRPTIPGTGLRPSPAFGIGAALGAGLWWALNEDFNWATSPRPYMPGWEHVCGPYDYPGPPYLHQSHWAWLGPPSLACNVPIGGQALIVDTAPAPGDDLLYFAWGPNNVNRYYAYDQYTRPAGSGAPDAALRPHMMPAPALLGPGAAYVADPNTWVPNPIAPPIPLSPYFPPEPPYPEGPSRGYLAPDPGRFTLGRVETVSDVHGRNLTVSTPAVRPRDRQPEPRERERKAELGSALGRAVITSFKALQTWGQINGAVDALWRAIPKRLRTPNASWWQKYADVYEHFDEIDLAAAAGNAAAYAAQVRAFGAAYDRQQRFLSMVAGENGGWSIARGLTNQSKFGVRVRLRRKRVRRNYTRRWRRYSGRWAPNRRYQQWRLREQRRKMRWRT